MLVVRPSSCLVPADLLLMVTQQDDSTILLRSLGRARHDYSATCPGSTSRGLLRMNLKLILVFA